MGLVAGAMLLLGRRAFGGSDRPVRWRVGLCSLVTLWIWARGAVLWPLAHALLGSSRYYESLWARRAPLLDLPVLILWGMKDPALKPALLERWTESLPGATIVKLDQHAVAEDGRAHDREAPHRPLAARRSSGRRSRGSPELR
jgi:pimeloyl-ACP methyl ester carboxylesterase